MKIRSNRLAALVFAPVLVLPAAVSASTLVGPINADGTWYTVGNGFQSPSTDFSVGYTFNLPSDSNGKTQLVDLSSQINFFQPIIAFSWQLDGGTKNAVVSNTIQSLGLIPKGNHTLTFSGQNSMGGIFGFSGQVAFLQNLSVPLPATWLMFGSGLVALGVTRKFRKS
ncbi:MAG: PEP-CTERM sorting domain-containing protein [Methylococcaceae bacterium]|nr:PEP-CTERM sorting domain-containing protein [Methylococcaceae bacterium]